MLDKESDFRYVSFRNDSGELIDLDLSVDLLPLRADDEHAILAGKDIAFLYESMTERKFAAAIGSTDDFVSFSRELVAPSFHGLDVFSNSNTSPPVRYALDESVFIPRVVYSERYKDSGSWNDLFDKASISSVTVKELPSVDRIICKEPVLAAFDNQAKLNRFYTPNLSTVRAATYMRVEAAKESVQVSVADTDSCYPNSGNNIYPPSVTASTENSTIHSEDGEIVAFERYENSSYKGHFFPYGFDDATEGFVENRWRSQCYTFTAGTGYDLYQLSPGAVNIAYGAKYRAVFYFSYYQEYAVYGFKDSTKNISGLIKRGGYLIGDEHTVPEFGVSFASRNYVFTPGILYDIRKHYQKIDPVSEGFLSATNAPDWRDLAATENTPDGSLLPVRKEFTRRYKDRIVLKPMGYIVTLGNHTRWKS